MRMIPFRSLMALIILAFSLPCAAGEAITKTVIDVGPDAERVTFHLTGNLVISKYFRLDNPPRLVIDMPTLRNSKGIGLSPAYRGSLVKAIRYAQFDAQTTRMVIDLQTPIESPVARVIPPEGSEPWRIVIDLVLDPAATQRAARSRNIAPQPPKQYEPSPVAKPQPPARSAAEVQALANASAQRVNQSYRERKGVETPPQGEYAFTPIPARKPVEMTPVPGYKPVIVIDAGHGGKDIGAEGAGGIREKDITLQYAKALRDTLEKSGRYRVVLTREDDRFLLLKERVARARQQGGDMFISLHADSNINPRAEGLSVYTVSEEASDAEAEALAAQENLSDTIGGIELAHEDKAVADILIDLATTETRAKASLLAESILASMDSKIPLITNAHRYAGFRVLKAPDIPSVLIEVGFLTNSRDERRVLTHEYRDKVTRSILRGIDTYFAAR